MSAPEQEIRTGPNGCHAAIIVKGEHFWCDGKAGHTGWPHGSTAAETVWRGSGPSEDAADTEVTVMSAVDHTASYVLDLMDPHTEDRHSVYMCDECFGVDAADHGQWHAEEARP